MSEDRRRFLAAVAIVIVVFAVTLFVRIPRLDDALFGGRHCEGTARTLRHMQIWDEVGLAETHFMMRTTHTAPADTHIPDIGFLPDDQGIYYYTSFPPLFPLAPYLAFKALGIEPSIVSVRTFNLMLQALTCAILFVLALRVLRPSGPRSALVGATVAASFYAAAPSLLWFHSNAYISSSLSTPLLALAVYLAVRWIGDEAPGWVVRYGFVATVALLAYTDWLAVTFAAGTVILAVVRRDRPRYRSLAVATVSATAVVLALMFVQYSSVAGPAALIEALGGKYAMRSGVAETSHHSILSLRSWGLVAKGYADAFLPILVMTGVLAAPALASQRMRAGLAKLAKGPLGLALLLIGLATVLHHLVLFSHTVIHDFNMMKSALVVSLGSGALIAAGYGRIRRFTSAVAATLLVLALGVGAMYWGVETSLERNWGDFSQAQAFGQAVAASGIQPDEVLFLWTDTDFYTGSAAVYYAGRNLVRYTTAEQAAGQIERTGAVGGVLINIKAGAMRSGTQDVFITMSRIGLDGQVVE